MEIAGPTALLIFLNNALSFTSIRRIGHPCFDGAKLAAFAGGAHKGLFAKRPPPIISNINRAACHSPPVLHREAAGQRGKFGLSHEISVKKTAPCRADGRIVPFLQPGIVDGRGKIRPASWILVH